MSRTKNGDFVKIRGKTILIFVKYQRFKNDCFVKKWRYKIENFVKRGYTAIIKIKGCDPG